jgi:hypothetical protein
VRVDLVEHAVNVLGVAIEPQRWMASPLIPNLLGRLFAFAGSEKN